jgi:hypothetical protein
MRLLITDVTEMGGGNFCVAGWDAQAASMVRPLPNGSNWTANGLAIHGINPGVTVDFALTGAQSNGAFPHRTEDRIVDPNQVVAQNIPTPAWLSQASAARALTVQDAFNGYVQHNGEFNGRRQGVHIQTGVQTRSLWGLQIPRQNINFITDFDKLKAIVVDANHEYIIAVSSKILKDAYRAGGHASVNALLPAQGVLHVRLGLARAWGAQPDKCYLMVNGVFW